MERTEALGTQAAWSFEHLLMPDSPFFSRRRARGSRVWRLETANRTIQKKSADRDRTRRPGLFFSLLLLLLIQSPPPSPN